MKANTHRVENPPQHAEVFQQSFDIRYEYPVYFTQDLFAPTNTSLVDAVSCREPDITHRLIVFIDENVIDNKDDLLGAIDRYVDYHQNQLALACPPVVCPGGEAVKNDPALVESLQHTLVEQHMDRHSFVIGIGGGAFLDLIGYVAATTHRGIRHIRVPTTVLSQNDSGVGVKNGVNAFGAKNLLGTFAPPFAVLNDLNFLKSLSDRDRIAGIAEAVKVALIRDARFFEWLEDNADDLSVFEDTATAYMIRRCAELHMHQIAHGGDPFESGSARPLDYGHWAAHKLESLTQHELRHGEAVAIGLALDTRYSVACGMLAKGEENRVYRLLRSLGFKLWHAALEQQDAASNQCLVVQGLGEFREHLGGELTITLLEGIGVGVEVHEMDETTILHCIEWLKEQDGNP